MQFVSFRRGLCDNYKELFHDHGIVDYRDRKPRDVDPLTTPRYCICLPSLQALDEFLLSSLDATPIDPAVLKRRYDAHILAGGRPETFTDRPRRWDFIILDECDQTRTQSVSDMVPDSSISTVDDNLTKLVSLFIIAIVSYASNSSFDQGCLGHIALKN